MTVSSQTTKVPYACDGTTIVFPITFPYFEEANIRVVLRHLTTTDQRSTTLANRLSTGLRSQWWFWLCPHSIVDYY